MLKTIVRNSLLVVGTYTAITKAPEYIGHFVYGFKAGMRGVSIKTAINERFPS